MLSQISWVTATSEGITHQPGRLGGYLLDAVMHGLYIAAAAYGPYRLIPQFH